MTARTETSGHNGSWIRRALALVIGWSLLLIPAHIIQNSALARSDATAKPLLAGAALQDALQQRRGLVTSGRSLRIVLNELQSDTGIPLLLDRRTDPTSSVNLSTGFVAVADTIRLLAARSSADVSLGDNCVVVGPPRAVRRLKTLTAINRTSIDSLRGKMDRKLFESVTEARDVSWPALATPRQLLTERAAEIGLIVSNPESIPHDVWAEAVLPLMSFSDFATLILNQFDCSFELTPTGHLTITPVPEFVTIEKRHRMSLSRKKEIEQLWSKEFPGINVSWRGNTATLAATVEVHERLEELIAGQSSRTVAAAGLLSKRFTLTLPPGTQLRTLVESLKPSGVPVRFRGISDAEVQALLQRTVSMEVKQMPAREFFEKAFAGLGAKISVTDAEVVLEF